MTLPSITTSKIVAVGKALGRVALGGALAALAAWASQHQAADPAIAAAVALLVREVHHYVQTP